MGNREIKTSNKTKEEIEEGFSLRVTTPSRASEPDLDLAGSRTQSGSVSNSWLVILPMANYHIFPSQCQSLLSLTYLFSSSYLSNYFEHSSCMINSTAALRGTFILELMPRKHGRDFLITIVRSNLTNRRGFLLIRAQFVLQSAYYYSYTPIPHRRRI